MKFNIGEKVKTMLQNWLNIVPAPAVNITLMEKTNFETDVMRSQIWYRGDASELLQFFKQLGKEDGSFWSKVPDGSCQTVRKIHTGLPAIIADTLAYIVKSDLVDVEIDNADWEEISKKIGFNDIVGTAVVETLVSGDGAFKISVGEGQYPEVSFFSADRCEYEYSGRTVTAITFRTDYVIENKTYHLYERYSKGRIESQLIGKNNQYVTFDKVPELANIKPVIEFDGDFVMAVPVRFYDSKKYPDRGKSIFDGGKSDCFDALDEVVSQWWDAIRAGRVSKYIPESLVPRNLDDGSLMSVNSFGTEFIVLESPVSETGGRDNKIEVVQPEIKYDAFVSSYTSALLMCLQGLVSPATLGIDVGKMSSADAQREKKDVTGNTRNTITSALESCLPQFISSILKTYDIMRGIAPGQYDDIKVSFGEYGAPDFDSRVETVGKSAAYGIMSIETQVNELWGSSKDDKWKESEVQRIMSEKGLLEADEPSVGDA